MKNKYYVYFTDSTIKFSIYDSSRKINGKDYHVKGFFNTREDAEKYLIEYY